MNSCGMFLDIGFGNLRHGFVDVCYVTDIVRAMI